MFFSRFRIPTLALILLTACQRQSASPTLERIAILRFENLGPDLSSDWMGRAFSEIIATEAAGAPGVSVISSPRLHSFDAQFGRRPNAAPGISVERMSALAAGANRIAYGQYALRNGILQASLTVEDVGTGKMIRQVSASAPAANLVQEASALALRITPHLVPYATANAQVVKAYVNALEGANLAGSAENLQQAIALDPNFAPAYRQLAQLKAQQNDVQGSLAVLNQALARGNAIGDSERARIRLQSALLRNDSAARQQALADLAKADPADPLTWRELALSAMAGHQYPAAVDAFRKTLELVPADPDSWNQLGYAAAHAGDNATATDALLHYQKLLPASPNPLDSLGDVNLIAGRLPEAESYYLQAARKDATFFAGLDFLKAALAHLMTGDVPGADALAQQYFQALTAAHDPLLDYRKAQWSFISGRRKIACQQMAEVARVSEVPGPLKDVAAHAYVELAVWNLMLGNRDAAVALARKAAALATPSSANQAALVQFLTQPAASAAAWEARANLLAPNPAQAPVRNLALATALLFAQQFPAAAALLQPMYDSATSPEEGLPVWLAWALLETGRLPQAAELLRFNPPLADTGLSWSTPLYFPRIFYLRAVVAQKQGKADEARKNFQIFQQLSGPDPLLWGEEKKSASGSEPKP